MNPTVLVIGGSDSSGGAGVQADLRAIQACHGVGLTLLTAVTAQSTSQVLVEPVRQAMLNAQAQSMADVKIQGIKTGMLPTVEAVHVARDFLASRESIPCVVDPVTHASSGSRLMSEVAYAHFVDEVLPLADLVTPNAHEALKLCGMKAGQLNQREEMAEKLLDSGCRAVLLKGGHYEPNRSDLLVTSAGRVEFTRPSHPLSVRGTGCFLAAAIATGLAKGLDLVEAVRSAHTVLDAAWRRHVAIGPGLRLLNATALDGETK